METDAAILSAIVTGAGPADRYIASTLESLFSTMEEVAGGGAA